MSHRAEKVNTQAVLRGYAGIANGTDPKIRMEERDRVLAYWPDDLIRPVTTGDIGAPPWRLLLDPTAWEDVPPEKVAEFVRTSLQTKKAWPSLDGLRRAFGRVSNHRSPGEVVGQESLL